MSLFKVGNEQPALLIKLLPTTFFKVVGNWIGELSDEYEELKISGSDSITVISRVKEMVIVTVKTSLTDRSCRCR